MRRQWKWKMNVFTFLAVAGMLAGSVIGANAGNLADTVYFNGKIYTMTDLLTDSKPDFSKLKSLTTETAQTVEMVATKDGKIVFAGTRADGKNFFDDAAQKVDLDGRTMLPGLIDGHGHFPTVGMYDLYEVNLNSKPLGPISTQQDIIDAIQKKCGEVADDEWVLGWNYDDSIISPAGHPQKKDFDGGACASHPVWLYHISGHMSVVNQTALDMAKASNPDGYQSAVEKGNINESTGLMLESVAMALIMNLDSFPQNATAKYAHNTEKSLAHANQMYASKGITTADDGGHVAMQHVPMFQKGIASNTLKLRVVFHPSGFNQTDPDPMKSGDQGGGLNRMCFGWTDEGGIPFTLSWYANGTNATPIGSDITQLQPLTPTDAQFSNFAPMPLPTTGWDTNFKDKIFLGAYKLFSDGSPQGYTALMKRPGYYDWGTHTAADSFDYATQAEPKFLSSLAAGNTSAANMKNVIALYHKYGIGTETHTNGNLGAEEWVAAMEAAVSDPANANITDTRHTSIHAQFMELQQVQRLTGNYADAATAIGKDTDQKMYTDLEGVFANRAYTSENANGLSQDVLAARMKAQNLCNSYYINHTWWWGKRHRDIFQGVGRASNMSPVGWSLTYNQPYTFHNDTFVLPIDQLRSTQAAVTRATATTPVDAGGEAITGEGKDVYATRTLPSRAENGVPVAGSERIFPNYDHRANVLQALLGVTYMPAWQNRLENKIGSIRPEMLADFTILDQDPATVEPLHIADIRITTTIVGDTPVHGFLPGSSNFTSTPEASYMVADNVVVSNVAATKLEGEAADKAYALKKGETRYGASTLNATVTENAVALFQMDIIGNNTTAGAFKLYNTAVSTNPVAFTYGKDANTEGKFWIAPMSDVQNAVTADATLESNVPYVVFFTVKDGGTFDTDTAAGKVASSVTLVTTGTLPSNRTVQNEQPQPEPQPQKNDDDSSSGCTIGSNPAYDLAILVLALIGLTIFRKIRRRG